MVPHDVVTGQVLVEQVAPASPADRAGIQDEDILLSISGKPVRNIAEVHQRIQFSLGKETAIVVRHSGGTTREVTLIPRLHPPEDQGAIGVRISLHNPTVVTERLPLWQAVPMGVGQFAETFVLFAYGIVGTVTGALPGEVIGPVGIVQITGEIAKSGMAPLLQFAALISLIVGVINLFPIPALDGGRIVFVLLEWIRRGKRVSPKTEGRIHLAGFIVLISLILLVTYRDILRIVTGDSLVP